MKGIQPLLDKMIELRAINTYSKHDQLVYGAINAIDAKILKKGDRLPSINIMVHELGYARKTIVKAYEELKRRGLVESIHSKGYFITSVNTKVKLKLALLLFAFQTFQEDFYNTFREMLGKKYQIDIFFHHNNIEVFKNILDSISGKYGMYVIAPIPVPEIADILQCFSEDQLLIIDRYVCMPEAYSYIAQEFEETTYTKLVSLLPAIKNYEKFVLFYNDDADYPAGILRAFQQFTKTYGINGTVERTYRSGSVKKGTLYFFISDHHLWEVLRDCSNKNYTINKDIGIISHNDNAVKEIIFGGITTISVNFKKMAEEAANYIKYRTKIHRILPSEIKRRNSL